MGHLIDQHCHLKVNNFWLYWFSVAHTYTDIHFTSEMSAMRASNPKVKGKELLCCHFDFVWLCSPLVDRRRPG